MNLNIRDQHWIDDAACGSQVDDWLWFDHGERDRDAALEESKKVCGGCVVRQSCLEYALADPGLDGIWGATTAGERRRLLRNGGRESRGKFGPRPIDSCLRGHDTSGPDSRDAGNRCRECRREDRRKQQDVA